VFLLRHIWKKAPRRSLLAVVFALGLSLVSQPALALGETFTWANADETSITATGGNFGTATATFAKTGDVSGGATFSGAATYTCAGQSKTGQLTITVDAQNYKKVYPTAGAITGADDSCGFLSAFISKANVNPETGQATSAAPSANECDQGSLTWLACPVIDNVAGTISKLAQGVLEPFLQVKPISADTTPQLYAAWSHIRDLAEVLFILVFFVMIGANMLQQDIGGVDQYTVKKTLPRLVVAAILVQFSFLISSLIVDIGNILGGGVSTLLTSITNPSEGPASIFNVFQNLIVGSLAAVVGAAPLVLRRDRRAHRRRGAFLGIELQSHRVVDDAAMDLAAIAGGLGDVIVVGEQLDEPLDLDPIGRACRGVGRAGGPGGVVGDRDDEGACAGPEHEPARSTGIVVAAEEVREPDHSRRSFSASLA